MMESVIINNGLTREVEVLRDGDSVIIVLTNTSERTECVAASLTPDVCKALEDALATARKEATPTDSSEGDSGDKEHTVDGYEGFSIHVCDLAPEGARMLTVTSPQHSVSIALALDKVNDLIRLLFVSPPEGEPATGAKACDPTPCGAVVKEGELGAALIWESESTCWSHRITRPEAMDLREVLDKFIHHEPDAPELEKQEPKTDTKASSGPDPSMWLCPLESRVLVCPPDMAICRPSDYCKGCPRGTAEPARPDVEVIAEHGESRIIVIHGIAWHFFGMKGTRRCIENTRIGAQQLMLEWGNTVDDAYQATQNIDN